eukprot:6706561-Prymnesium_polylepis.1
MELCDQGTLLRHLMRHQPHGLSEDEARPHFAQMAEAVAHLHSMGIAHRDLKLDNFFCATNARGGLAVRLGDPGWASLAVLRPTAGADAAAPPPPQRCFDFAGTDRYAAPELWPFDHTRHLEAAPPADGYDPYAADVWSLGVCLFVLLANMMPLEQANADDGRFELLCQCERDGATPYVVALYEDHGLQCTLSQPSCAFLSCMLSVSIDRRPLARALVGCWSALEAAATEALDAAASEASHQAMAGDAPLDGWTPEDEGGAAADDGMLLELFEHELSPASEADDADDDTYRLWEQLDRTADRRAARRRSRVSGQRGVRGGSSTPGRSGSRRAERAVLPPRRQPSRH